MEVICFQFPHFPSYGLTCPKFLRNHSCVSCHGGVSCLQVGRWDPVSQERQPVCGQRVKSTVSPGNPDFTATDPFAKKHTIQNHCKWRDSSLGSSYHPADQNVFWKLHAGTEWIYFWELCALKWNRVEFVENEKWVVERFPLGRITVWWHGHGNQWSADALFYSAARFLLCRGEPEPRSQATVPLDDLRPSSVCLTSPDCSPAQWCLVLQMFARSSLKES